MELTWATQISEFPMKSRFQPVKQNVPLLNSASYHEDIWGNGEIIPHILNLRSTVKLWFNDLSYQRLALAASNSANSDIKHCLPQNSICCHLLASHAASCMFYLQVQFNYYNLPDCICILWQLGLKLWSGNSSSLFSPCWGLLWHTQLGMVIVKFRLRSWWSCGVCFMWPLNSGGRSSVPTGFVASEPVWKETNLSSCRQSNPDSPVILPISYPLHWIRYPSF